MRRTNKKPEGVSFLRRACLETGIPLPDLVTTGTAAKIDVKAWQSDMNPAVAAVAGTMAGAVTAAIAGPVRLIATMPGTVSATMAGCVLLIAAVAGVVTAAMRGPVRLIAAMAGTVPAAVTLVGVTVVVTRLRGGRSEHGKASGDGEEGEEFFHDGWWFALDGLPHPCGVIIRRGAAAAIRDSRILFL